MTQRLIPPRALLRTLGPCILALAALGGCSKSGEGAATPAAPAAAAQPPAPAAPAKPMKMVCRNSQTGAKAKCGTPGAVMVGMEPG